MTSISPEPISSSRAKVPVVVGKVKVGVPAEAAADIVTTPEDEPLTLMFVVKDC